MDLEELRNKLLKLDYETLVDRILELEEELEELKAELELKKNIALERSEQDL